MSGTCGWGFEDTPRAEPIWISITSAGTAAGAGEDACWGHKAGKCHNEELAMGPECRAPSAPGKVVGPSQGRVLGADQHLRAAVGSGERCHAIAPRGWALSCCTHHQIRQQGLGMEGKGSQTTPWDWQKGSKSKWAQGARDPEQRQHSGQDLPHRAHHPGDQHC